MNAASKSSHAVKVASRNAVDIVSRASLISMAALSGLVGIWATACLVSAVLANGPGKVFGGFVAALLG